MNKVSVTGSTGFAGVNLMSYLIKNKITGIPVSREDLNGHIQLNDSNVVVHLAGKAHDLKVTSDPSQYYEVNYELTKKLYDAFLRSDASKFIFISSVKAAADSVKDILDEEVVPAPQTHYGKSKLMAEDYIKAQPLPEGKSYYILRPCMIHGPGNKGNLNLLYKFVTKGIPYPLAAFRNQRSFLSIENLCFIIKGLIMSDSVPSGIYNVADDEALSTNEVVSILADSAKKKARLLFIPKKLIMLMAKTGDRIKLPLNTERLNKLTENYIVSNKKIKQALGVQLPLNTNAGLKITADSFK